MVTTEASPVFTVRPKKKRAQIRFWADEALFKRFRAEVEKHGVKTQEAYEDFMIWFINESENGRVKIR